MATDIDFHTRAVGWLKIVLPMAALGLLATLFLFARSPTNQGQAIPFAQIEQIAKDQQITAPQFSSVTDDGATLVVRAASAQPDSTQSNLLNVTDLTLDMQRPNGTTIVLTAPTSVLDTDARTAKLSGLARLTTSNGYEIETDGLRANLKTGEIMSDGGITALGPFGQVTAGQVHFQVPQAGKAQQILFTQGVRLLYTPSTR